MQLPLATAARPVTSKRLLVITFAPAQAKYEDFLDIAHEVGRASPETAVAITTPRQTANIIPPRFWQLPALTVGIGTSLGAFRPPRGTIRHACAIRKLVQFQRFRDTGIETPETAVFEPGRNYDGDPRWGEFVVLKPASLTSTSSGLGVKLIRTRRLKDIATPERCRELTGIDGPVLMQSFIDTGEYPVNWRVLTLFGRPLYSMRFRCPIPMPPLTSDDATIEQAVIETKHPDLKTKYNVTEMRELTSEPHILAFAGRMAEAFPRIPLLGLDILEDPASGTLWALEINAGGNVWHFSSPRGELGRSSGLTREKRVAQFGAWKVAAAALIDQLKYAS